MMLNVLNSYFTCRTHGKHSLNVGNSIETMTAVIFVLIAYAINALDCKTCVVQTGGGSREGWGIPGGQLPPPPPPPSASIQKGIIQDSLVLQ